MRWPLQCCGTGTAGTETFCFSETGTHSGSELKPGPEPELNPKLFQSRNRNRNKLLRFHNTGTLLSLKVKWKQNSLGLVSDEHSTFFRKRDSAKSRIKTLKLSELFTILLFVLVLSLCICLRFFCFVFKWCCEKYIYCNFFGLLVSAKPLLVFYKVGGCEKLTQTHSY